jgi:hypothetical protein
VRAYYQKPDPATLARLAMDGRVLTDSDFFVAPDACRALLTADVPVPSPHSELCGWSHFLPTMAPMSPPLDRSRPDLAALTTALRPFQLHVLNLSQDPHHGFYHLGTLPEYRHHMTHGLRMAPSVRSHLPGTTLADSAVVLASTLVDCVVGPGAVVEFCHLHNATVGPGAILSGVVWTGDAPVAIPPGLVVATIPLAAPAGAVTVFFGVEDDLKSGTSHCGVPCGSTDRSLYDRRPPRLQLPRQRRRQRQRGPISCSLTGTRPI